MVGFHSNKRKGLGVNANRPYSKPRFFFQCVSSSEVVGGGGPEGVAQQLRKLAALQNV